MTATLTRSTLAFDADEADPRLRSAARPQGDRTQASAAGVTSPACWSPDELDPKAYPC
jgi:hypothetical protein